MKFAAAYSGELSRQRQTAEAVNAGYGFPEIAADPGQNEFDLDRMQQQIAPQMWAANADFRREQEAMHQQAQASGAAPEATVHHRWLPCDSAVMNAWMANRHEYVGETWEQFFQRVVNCRLALDNAQRNDKSAVFTSAAPITIWTGLALDIRAGRAMKLAAALQNTLFTILKQRDGNLRLFSLNATPQSHRTCKAFVEIPLSSGA